MSKRYIGRWHPVSDLCSIEDSATDETIYRIVVGEQEGIKLMEALMEAMNLAHSRSGADELRTALRNCLSLVELKFGNTDPTANAAIEQALAALNHGETND